MCNLLFLSIIIRVIIGGNFVFSISSCSSFYYRNKVIMVITSLYSGTFNSCYQV